MNELIKELPWFKKLEILRVIKGWSQDEAAKRCFTGQKAYWAWENGNVYPRKNSRRAITHAFHIREEEIFGEVR